MILSRTLKMQPWEHGFIEGETEKEYRDLLTYIEMGVKRSLRKLWTANHAKDEKNKGTYPSWWGNRAKELKWERRAIANDIHKTQQAMINAQKEAKKTNEEMIYREKQWLRVVSKKLKRYEDMADNNQDDQISPTDMKDLGLAMKTVHSELERHQGLGQYDLNDVNKVVELSMLEPDWVSDSIDPEKKAVNLTWQMSSINQFGMLTNNTKLALGTNVYMQKMLEVDGDEYIQSITTPKPTATVSRKDD